MAADHKGWPSPRLTAEEMRLKGMHMQKDSAGHGFPFSVRALTVMVVTAVIVAFSGLSAMALPATQFELDGNAVTNGHDDWSNVLAGTGGDFNHSSMSDATNDSTYFTGGGSKDGHDLSDWAYNNLGAQDKDEITNAYSAAYINNGHLDLYFGADRYANSGDSTAGFWFFQNKVTLDGSGGFNGVHKVGDLLIVSDFTNGGAISGIAAYKWNGSGLTPFTATGGDCATHLADALCAIVNQVDATSPWAYTPKSGSAGTFPAIGSFLEGGIDLNDSNVFGANVPCFSTYLVETRASQSTDSTLSDFALGSVNTCGKVTGTKYNDVNGNGTRDAGEPGLSGWTITLDKNGTSVTTTTDASGNFEFDDVEPGTYTVCETFKSAWFQTQPSSGQSCPDGHGYSVTLTLGQTASGNVFGNTQHPDLTITKTADDSHVTAGDAIGYTITVTNNGPGTAANVKLSDTLPTNTGTWSFDSPSAGWGGTCGITAGVLSCGGASGVTLAASASLSVHVSSTTSKASCPNVTNHASVASSNNDPGTVNSTDAVITVDCPTLTITKVADATTVSAGDSVGYTITVHNNGPGNAYGVKLSDTLPTNTGTWSFDNPSAGWGGTCGITSGALSCGGASGVTLASGADLTVHISATTSTASCPNVSNVAHASSSNDGSPSTDPVVIAVNCPTITVSKSADDSTVNAGDSIGYTITVHNSGPGNAYGVKLTDTLPTNTGTWSFDNPSVGWGGTCGITSGVLSCGGASGVTLASGASLSVHISSTTSTASCPNVSNVAHASSSNDGSPSTSSIVITVNCPNVTVAKSADDSEVSAGDQIGYTITVHNGGAGDATGVKLTDTLPTNTGTWSFDNPSVGWGGTCGITSGVLSCGGASGVTLASGGSLSVHVTSTTSAASCTQVSNEAFASSTNNDPASVHSAIVSITVDCPDVSIAKVADASPVTGGDTIGFKITVTNAGPGTAHDVVITDPLLSTGGLSWSIDATNTTAQGCSITGGVLTCNQGDLGVGSVQVHVTSPTTAAECGSTIPNTATVVLSNGDGGQASASIDVNCPVLGINLAKDGPAEAHVGDTIHYTLTVTNGTDEPLHNIVVTDPVCNADPVYVSGDDGDNILQSGESWIYTCDHVVTSTDPDPLPNTATVVGQDKLGRSTEAQASHSVDILHPSISIVKTANPISGGPGDPVTYTYVVKNTSKDTTLYNVTVTDDKLGAIGTIPVLLPGQSVTLTKTTKLPSTAGLLTNVGTATGADHLGKKVSAHDDATVTIVLAVRLPRTGSNSRLPLETGFALLGLGFALVGIASRRKTVVYDYEQDEKM